MKSCLVIHMVAVVCFSQLRSIQADMEAPKPAVPVGPDREGPSCPAAVPAAQGTPGPAGSQGLPGIPGVKGDGGLQGPKGAAGFPGLAGKRGRPGDKGNSGTGGFQGARGPKGQQGIIGPKGLRGDNGEEGVSIKGPPGIDGLPGAKGDPGEDGVIGIKGEPGDVYTRVFFTLRRTAAFSSTSDSTRLPFDVVATAYPGTSMIDLDTGMFTCPVPGIYVFTFSVLTTVGGTLEHDTRIHLYKNEEEIVSALSTTSDNYQPITSSATLELKRGDMVYLTLYGSVRVADTDEYTSFNGFLIS